MLSASSVSQVVCSGVRTVTVLDLDDATARRQFPEVTTDTAQSLSLIPAEPLVSIALMWSRLFLDTSSPLEHVCEATINISRAKLEPLEARSVYLIAYFGRSVKLKKTRSVFGDTSY